VIDDIPVTIKKTRFAQAQMAGEQSKRNWSDDDSSSSSSSSSRSSNRLDDDSTVTAAHSSRGAILTHVLPPLVCPLSWQLLLRDGG